jgi:hypothetical protein
MVGLAAIEDPPCDLRGVSTSVSYSRWALSRNRRTQCRRQVAFRGRIFA